MRLQNIRKYVFAKQQWCLSPIKIELSSSELLHWSQVLQNTQRYDFVAQQLCLYTIKIKLISF